MKDPFNVNKNTDKDSASIIKVIRPGSNEYDNVHTDKINTPDYFENTIDSFLSDDKNVEEFAILYMDKLNKALISGDKIGARAYWLYERFKYRHDTL